MMEFSRDPRESERQIQAIILYLTAFGYVDGEFDSSEKAFIREYIAKIVAHKLGQNEAYQSLPPEALNQIRQEQEEHYNQVFEMFDAGVQEDLTEAVTRDETPESFIRFRLKTKSFETFQSFDEENRSALMDVIDEFILADGVSHPAEVAFRNDLAELLETEILLDQEDLEIVPATLQVTGEVPREVAEPDHPLLRKVEVDYSTDPKERDRQAEEEMQTVRAEMALLDSMRDKARGRLASAHGFGELMDGGDAFLDGYVYGIPPKPGRAYEITVLGDLHGCYSCLKGALMQADFFNKVEAFQKDPEKSPEPKLVLLGDYIDRGRFSYQGILRAVMELHQRYPEFVFPLRGNHEYYIEYEGRIYGGVLPAEAINDTWGKLPENFFHTYMEFFEQIPTVAVFDQIFFVHAGIPKDVALVGWENLEPLNQPDVRFQMIWSDPSEAEYIPEDLQEESARFPFGTRQFARFMSGVGCNVMVRGHTKVVEGFRTVVDDGTLKLLNLFSAGGKNNEDLPADSSYRAVTPKALTINYKDGEMTASPWVIDYERFNLDLYNRFFR